MPGQIGTSIRSNTRRNHSGDRESDAIDAAGLAQARERFALLGRDVSQLSDDQLRNLLSELERRFRDEGLTNAICARRIDHRKTASTSISFGFNGPCSGATASCSLSGMLETTLYPALKQFLESAGFRVQGEADGCDVVAVSEEEPRSSRSWR
jgi:hypothetical protein